MRKNLDSLIEQALENIKNDRQETEILLSSLQLEVTVRTQLSTSSYSLIVHAHAYM